MVVRTALILQECWEFIMRGEEVPPVCLELVAIHQNQLQKHSRAEVTHVGRPSGGPCGVPEPLHDGWDPD